jgi:hypothetical protein
VARCRPTLTIAVPTVWPALTGARRSGARRIPIRTASPGHPTRTGRRSSLTATGFAHGETIRPNTPRPATDPKLRSTWRALTSRLVVALKAESSSSRSPTPGWPSTAPTTSTIRRPAGTRAANTKQPPAAEVDPVLSPNTPCEPSRSSRFSRSPATGSRARGNEAIWTSAGIPIAASASRTWSRAVLTVNELKPLASE